MVNLYAVGTLKLHLCVSGTASIHDLTLSARKTTVYVYFKGFFMQLFLIDMCHISLVGSTLEKVCTCALSLSTSCKHWVRVLSS